MENRKEGGQYDPLDFQKSSYSFRAQDCVEVAATGEGHVVYRDSKLPDGPTLVVTTAAALALNTAIKAGEFNDL